MPPHPTDYIDVVDELDQPTGELIQRQDALGRHVGFRVAHVFILDRGGRLLLQKISPQHGRSPHKWGSSVAAYVRSGESYFDAARRRMQEEIGLDAPLIKLGSTRMIDSGSTKFIELFGAHGEEVQIVDQLNIEALSYWGVEEIERLLVQDPATFTTTFPHVYSLFEIAEFGGRQR